MSEPRERTASALVVIDMQHVFRDADSQWATPGYDRAAERISRLTDAYRGEVIWTRFVRDPQESGSWSDYYARWNECREPEDSPVWDLTMPVADGDDIVSLPTFSKWGKSSRGSPASGSGSSSAASPPTAACSPPCSERSMRAST
ncbi:isochorismatase family protein [Leucobacter soli]|uniref:isochorismatase family protein n=1 Tax=Leucobacter soli TaxID=2812850 RepID=UPI00361D1246